MNERSRDLSRWAWGVSLAVLAATVGVDIYQNGGLNNRVEEPPDNWLHQDILAARLLDAWTTVRLRGVSGVVCAFSSAQVIQVSYTRSRDPDTGLYVEAYHDPDKASGPINWRMDMQATDIGKLDLRSTLDRKNLNSDSAVAGGEACLDKVSEDLDKPFRGAGH